MELTDLIRMNQLIRSRIDLAGFIDWYEALPHEERVGLLWYLHLFAQQAGGGEQAFRDATESAQLPEDHPLVRLMASFRGGWSGELGLALEEWLMRQEASDLRLLLPLLVYYFGFAEGEVFARETVESCNHWWHRDLLDPRVVRDLLNNPEYFRTALKDDQALKG